MPAPFQTAAPATAVFLTSRAKESAMRTALGFVIGILVGVGMTTALAQSERLPGDNYVNHVAIAVPNFDEAFAFYTQKMGFREAFTVRNDQGQPQLAYVQASRN